MAGRVEVDGVQRLLEQAHWDAEVVRDKLRRYVIEQLTDSESVLIIDETGFIKEGAHRWESNANTSDTAGHVENSQIGVFLCYAGNGGSAVHRPGTVSAARMKW